MLEQNIQQLIEESVSAVGRDDLFRTPLVRFSDASDERFAELKDLIGPWHKLPTDFLPSARSVISFFVPSQKVVVDEPKSVPGASPVWSEAYNEINTAFANINQKVIDLLVAEGYEATAIPATHTYDPKDLKATWSHRSAAVIAGLGHLGAHRLLIIEKGCGGRLSTVITSAVLRNDTPDTKEYCPYFRTGACGKCMKICPVHALTSDTFARFDCQDELNKNEATLEDKIGLKGGDTCGKCISVCPFAYME